MAVTAVADGPEPRPKNPLDETIALRVYEICVARGYVDGRDWVEVAKQVADQRGPSGKPRAA